MVYWYLFSGLLIVLLVLAKFFLFGHHARLRVLMYHRVSNNGQKDGLTVAVNNLEEQFNYLLKEGYVPILLSDLVKYVRFGKPLPKRPVLITFDDGYRDNYTVMYPLLKKYGMKANIFLVPSFLQNEQEPINGATDEYLHVSDINSMDHHLVEYGLHSFDHKNYKHLSPQELDHDIVKSKALLITMNIPFQPCLAFPYGAFPKRSPVKLHSFFSTLTDNKIALAFRIGNRLNSLPLRNPLLVQRLDVRGSDSFEKFVKLLRKGKQWI